MARRAPSKVTQSKVRQSLDVGRNVADNFETALRRAGKNSGVVVAFSFTWDAIEERA